MAALGDNLCVDVLKLGNNDFKLISLFINIFLNLKTKNALIILNIMAFLVQLPDSQHISPSLIVGPSIAKTL